MNLREALFAAALALSGTVVIYGIALVHVPAAWVFGGFLAAGWSWLVLSE